MSPQHTHVQFGEPQLICIIWHNRSVRSRGSSLWMVSVQTLNMVLVSLFGIVCVSHFSEEPRLIKQGEKAKTSEHVMKVQHH